MSDVILLDRKEYDELTHQVRHLETLSKCIVRLLISKGITIDDLIKRVAMVHELTNRISTMHDLMNNLKIKEVH